MQSLRQLIDATLKLKSLVTTATLTEGSEAEDHQSHHAKGNRAHRRDVFRDIVIDHDYIGRVGSSDHHSRRPGSSRSDADNSQADRTSVADECVINGWYRDR